MEGEGNICNNCASDYNNIDGKCKKKIESCSIYNEDGVCTACEIGFIVVRGLCVREVEAPTVPHCSLINEYGCVQC